MRHLSLLIWLLLCCACAFSQDVSLKVTKDTVRIENAELIIQNASKQTQGFLYNQNGGQTAFRRLGKAFQFKPGDTTFPAPGESVFTDSSFIGKHMKVWRNGMFQYRSYAKGISFDQFLGAITFYPPLSDTDRIYIEATEGFDTDNPAAVDPNVLNLSQLNTGVFDNGDNSFVLRWTTNHTSLYNYPVMGGMGSSTLEGVGTTPPNRLTDRIASWLASSSVSPTWMNVAAGGYTSFNLLPAENGGVPGHNITTLLNINPDFIYCCLASNDAAQGTPIATTMANLRKLDSIGRSKGVPVIFHTSQPRNGLGAYYPLLVGLTDSIKLAWPNRHVDAWAPVVDPDSAQRINPIYDSGDGIHLNAAGTQVIARALFKVLEKYFVPITGIKRYYVDTSYDGQNWTQYDIIPNGNTVKKSYTRPRNGLIYFRVRAEKNTGGFITSNVSSLVPPGGVNNADHRVVIDLGGDNQYTLNNSSQPDGRPTASPDIFGKYWNNWYGSGGALGFMNGSFIRDLVTTNNVTTPLSIEMIGTPALDGSVTTKAINFNGLMTAVGDYPVEAVRDNMFLNTAQTGETGTILKVRGLQSSNTYKIKLWGARVVDDGTRILQSRLGNQSWEEAKLSETRYSTGQAGDYNNAIVHTITGLDSVNIHIKPKNSTYAHISVIDISITGGLPDVPVLVIRDTAITLPKDSVLITPTIINPNGIPIGTYTWTQVSGPTVATARTPFAANTVIAGLTNGVYVFRLRMTTGTDPDDPNAPKISDLVTISVFPPSPKPTMRVYFSKTEAPPIPGWVNMAGDPAASVITVQDPVRLWMVNSIGTSSWVPFAGTNGSNADGMNTGNNSGYIPDNALKGYWFNSDGITAAHNLKISGLNPSKTYNITMVASRSGSNGATQPKFGHYGINGTVKSHDAWLNLGLTTDKRSEYLNISPSGVGIIYIDIYLPPGTSAFGSTSFINGLIIEEQ